MRVARCRSSGTCGRTGLAGVDQYPLEDRPGRRRSRAGAAAAGGGYAAGNPDRRDLARAHRHGASRQWLDTTGAPPPEEVAIPLLDLALEEAPDSALYGGLIHLGHGEPGRFRTLVPWI